MQMRFLDLKTGDKTRKMLNKSGQILDDIDRKKKKNMSITTTTRLTYLIGQSMPIETISASSVFPFLNSL